MTTEEAIKQLKEYILGMNYMDDEAVWMAINALEAQPCEDCVSRKEVIDIINFEDKWLFDAKSHNADTKIAFSGLNSRVKDLPSVQSTRPTGRWIDIQYFKNDDTYYRPKCPFCSIEPKEYSNFCPNCGARMEV